MPDVRRLPVPEGLAGERIDVGLSRLLGLSRSAAADLCSAGAVTVDGHVAAKSDRLVADAWLEVTLPEAAAIAHAHPLDAHETQLDLRIRA